MQETEFLYNAVMRFLLPPILLCACLYAQPSITISRPGDITQGNLTGIAINVYPYQSSGVVLVTLDGLKIAEYDLANGKSAFNFKYAFPNENVHAMSAVFSGNSSTAPCFTSQQVYVTPNPNWVHPSAMNTFISVRNQRVDLTAKTYRFEYQANPVYTWGIINFEYSDNSASAVWFWLAPGLQFEPVSTDPEWVDASFPIFSGTGVTLKRVSLRPFAEDLSLVIP